MIEIPSLDINSWVSELKPYQSHSINHILQSHSAEESIKIWLSANGPNSTVQFGGNNSPSTEPFFERFKAEFRKFVCGDPKYDHFRLRLKTEIPIANSIYISIISTALGVTLGYTAALLAPAVAIMLHLVGKIGVNAWCAL